MLLQLLHHQENKKSGIAKFWTCNSALGINSEDPNCFLWFINVVTLQGYIHTL